MIKALAMDVDGTLTDGCIYIGNDGEIMKAFWAHDAVGVRRLVKSGIVPIIITGRESNIIRIRAREMNVEYVYTNVEDKKTELLRIVKKMRLELSELAFIGDDVNDLDAMKVCGLIACPNDAVDEVKECSQFISNYKGGRGAVRELCDYLLRMDE